VSCSFLDNSAISYLAVLVITCGRGKGRVVEGTGRDGEGRTADSREEPRERCSVEGAGGGCEYLEANIVLNESNRRSEAE